MIKVCHMTTAHKRYDVRIFQKECASLAKHGYEVYLIVCDGKTDEVCDGVHIITTSFTPKNRLERMFKGSNTEYQKAIGLNADIYHIHDPELLPIARKLKTKGKKVIFDAHEDTQEQIMDKPWIPAILRNIISNLYGCYAKKIMSSLDALITVTPSLVDKLKGYNPKTVMVTNYPIVDGGGQNKHRLIKNYVCFAGGITEQWMHDVIINAIAKLDNVKYVLAGTASEKYLNHLRSLEGWDNVIYLGSIPHDCVAKVYENAIAGMVVNECVQVKKVGTLGNTKLFECMEAGVPVICTDYLLWKEIVEGNHCGICVNPDHSDEIVKAIKFLIDQPDEAEIMGNNGRQAVLEKYNWELEEGKLIDLYEQLLA